jgi:UDP-3-O-[3-hydroxymyristoyl] N-acetylglucosamine deacetylase
MNSLFLIIGKNMQQTLKQSTVFKGKGLHSGKMITATIMPAEDNEGITFIRRDVKDRDNIIPARWNNVEASPLCTLIKNDAGVEVRTIEHLMAAFAGMGIDNATIILDGAEVPILDGSSMPFIHGFENAGVIAQNATRHAIRILKPVEVVDDNGAMARFEPDVSSVFEFKIDFDAGAIGKQHRIFELMDCHDFKYDIAQCRTFTRMQDVKQLQSMGLIQGGGLDNAVVFDQDGVLNPEGLRETDEPVRHKILDAIGDCYLAGAPIIGRFISDRGGHALTNKLLRALMADQSAYITTTDYLGIGQFQNMSANAKLAYNA